ncbi:MAG: cytochrome b/b6 domain-containing protein [Rubrivivax sp.]
MSSRPGAVRVWDRAVRLLHWALVACVAAAWFTRDLRGPWHEWLGYGAAAIVASRLAWGFAGSPYARFAQFVRAPAATLAYARAVLAGAAPRYLGHNPLGGWMVLALLAAVAATCLSGWLFTTDWLWGYEWVEDAHAALAWMLVALVALHVGGVVFTSRHQKENLVRAMLTGDKPAPSGDDVA